MRIVKPAHTARGVVLGLLLLTAACAPKRPVAPEPEGFLFPSPPQGEAREAERVTKAWRTLVAGDPARAERAFRSLLRSHPSHASAETGLGYAQLQAGRPDAAVASFERVLQRDPDYIPALVGAATSAARQGEPGRALTWLRRAQAVAPEHQTVRRQLAEVRLQVTERRVAEAAEAVSVGDVERAVETYRMALDDAPELAGARLSLAQLLWDQGDAAASVAVLEADPTGDRTVLLQLGDALVTLGEHGRALDAYRRVLARDPGDEEALRRSKEVRHEIELLQMPEEYRKIPGAASITRADLAALVSVKVTALSRLTPGEPRVAVDITGSWARQHILRMLAFEVMSPYPNHTFQPGATARRGDLAKAVQRILDLVGHPPAPMPVLSDMSRTHLNYQAAGRSVAAGLMDLTPNGAFEAWRPVSGQEAVDVLEGLVRLIGP